MGMLCLIRVAAKQLVFNNNGGDNNNDESVNDNYNDNGTGAMLTTTIRCGNAALRHWQCV